jgi:hypothetical protein
MEAFFSTRHVGQEQYWPILLERGSSVQGTDQSQHMLLQSQAKFPDVPVDYLGMQEIPFVEAFVGGMCMGAMEMVFLEDWPGILQHVRESCMSMASPAHAGNDHIRRSRPQPCQAVNEKRRVN